MPKDNYPSLSDFEKRILLILEQRLCSISQVSRELNENREFVRGILESLRQKNHVVKTTVGKSTVYLPPRHASMFKILEDDKLQEKEQK